MNEIGGPPSRDNTMPVTADQFTEGLYISVFVGLYYAFNAYMPAMVWFTVREDDIMAMKENWFYKKAWQVLYMAHFLLFTPMALLWPLSYLGSSVIVNFYDLTNYWIGTVAGGVLYLSVATLFALAAFFYETDTAVSSGYIWQEMVLYIVLETFAWYVTVWEYPKAHE